MKSFLSKKTLLAATAIAFNCTSLTPASAGWTTNELGTVTEILAAQGYVRVFTTSSLNACSSVGTFYWPTTDALSDQWLAIALSARADGSEMRFLVDTGNPQCVNNAILTTGLHVK